jgi:hypothetical protein
MDVEFGDLEEGFASNFDYAMDMASDQLGYSVF